MCELHFLRIVKTIPLKNDRWRVFLDTEEYRQLLESAYEPPSRTVRQVRLEMRLMACSMRVDTVSELRYGQFEKRETPEGDRWMCTIQAKDSTEREAETRPRGVYIPADIMNRVNKRAKNRGLDDDDLLFSCSTRTIQRDVTRSAENAAIRSGNDDYRKVSAHDLRRYFATHLLFRHEVPAPVVRVLGGWKSDDAMFEYLVLPDDVLFERLGEANILGTSYDKLGRHDYMQKINATTDRLRDLLEEADTAETKSAAAQVESVFNGIEAINVALEEPDESGSESHEYQSSFQHFGPDEGGIANPIGTTKVAYLVCLITFSWAMSFGPIA